MQASSPVSTSSGLDARFPPRLRLVALQTMPSNRPDSSALQIGLPAICGERGGCWVLWYFISADFQGRGVVVQHLLLEILVHMLARLILILRVAIFVPS